MHFESRQTPGVEQVLVNRSKVACLPRGNRLEDATVKGAQTVVDVVHGRRTIALVIPQNPAAVVLNVASVVQALLAIHGHESGDRKSTRLNSSHATISY